VQLNNIDIPHENDTEDIDIEQSPEMVDHSHSKEWNEKVNKEALALE